MRFFQPLQTFRRSKDVTAQRMPFKDQVFKIIMNSFFWLILIGSNFIKNYSPLFFKLFLRESGMKNNIVKQLQCAVKVRV
ncbi:hypothetical protein D9M68_897270 [compost metagenome]